MDEHTSDNVRVVFNCGRATAGDVVPSAISAVHAAVVDNWNKLSNRPSVLWPDFGEMFSPARVGQIIDEIKAHNGCLFDEVAEYFPNCCHDLFCDFSQHDDGLFSIELFLPAKALLEVEGKRKQVEMIWEWWKGRTSFHTTLPGPGDMDEAKLCQWHEEYNRLGATPSSWPNIRRCFLNIVEYVKKALPTAEVEIDPRLMTETR